MAGILCPRFAFFHSASWRNLRVAAPSSVTFLHLHTNSRLILPIWPPLAFRGQIKGSRGTCSTGGGGIKESQGQRRGTGGGSMWGFYTFDLQTTAGALMCHTKLTSASGLCQAEPAKGHSSVCIRTSAKRGKWGKFEDGAPETNDVRGGV